MAHPLVNDNAMNLDDESLLSAYLDGQLDPDQLRSVESALLSNPQLSEQLRSLTILRDLVGGLSRDVSVDVSSAVLERIQSSRPWWVRLPAKISWPADRRRVFQAAGVLGFAAACIIVATIALNVPSASRHRPSNSPKNPGQLSTASNTAKRAAAPNPIRDEIGPGALEKPSSSDSLTSGDGATGIVKISDIPHTNAASELPDLDESRDLQHVRKLLDSPNLRRFFLVRGGRDGTGRQQVASVVEQTTHFGFYKITISHGIVIDPRHPEEATVFALLVNPKELDNLKERLTAALPDAIEETPVDPQIVTQLADIGIVQACPATPIVTIPQDALALRTEGVDGREHAAAEIQTVEPGRNAPVPPDRGGKSDHAPGSGSEVAKHAGVSAPVAAHSLESIPGHEDVQIASRASNHGPSPEKPEDLIVVLVWVTKSQSG
jgi:hypothetical protein